MQIIFPFIKSGILLFVHSSVLAAALIMITVYNPVILKKRPGDAKGNEPQSRGSGIAQNISGKGKQQWSGGGRTVYNIFANNPFVTSMYQG